MKVFVVGKLGEVIKKVYELEEALKENPDPVLVVELAAHQQILQAWPISSDQDELVLAINKHSFQNNLAELKDIEESILDCLATNPKFGILVAEYFMRLKLVRELMAKLNNIGMHIGPSPWLEIDEESIENKV